MELSSLEAKKNESKDSDLKEDKYCLYLVVLDELVSLVLEQLRIILIDSHTDAYKSTKIGPQFLPPHLPAQKHNPKNSLHLNPLHLRPQTRPQTQHKPQPKHFPTKATPRSPQTLDSTSPFTQYYLGKGNN